MIEVKINGTAYELKTLTVQQWQKISRFDMTNELYWPRILATALNVDESILKQVDRDGLELGVSLVSYHIEYGEYTPLKIKTLDTLNFGDFIDLDIWFANGIAKNLHLILERFTEDGNLETRIPAGIDAIKKITNWRKSIFRDYSGLFGYFDDEDIEEVEKSEETQSLDSARVWYDVIVRLANEDPLKMDAITELPFRAALNFMAWKKDDNIKQRAALQKANNKINL